jgi:chromosome segregation ATPase
MSTEAAALTEQTKSFLAKQSQDLQAMDNKIAALKADADAVADRLLQKSATLQGLSVKGREIRDETAQRRTDVLRLQHELEELRTDLYRLTSIRRDLTDRLLRTQIENKELADRTAQLNPQP